MPPSSRARPGPAPAVRRTVAAASAVLAVALAAGGCSQSASSQPGANPPTPVTPGGGGAVASSVVLGQVAGAVHQPNHRIFARHRARLLHRVGRAVDTWIDHGFVSLGYPRASFPTAFADFTGPARREARRQQALMTNWPLRHSIDGVVVKKRSIVVDVLAPHGRPAGATARVTLVFRTTGHRKERVDVHGRLFLEPAGHSAWRIFGYDVSKGAR